MTIRNVLGSATGGIILASSLVVLALMAREWAKRADIHKTINL